MPSGVSASDMMLPLPARYAKRSTCPSPAPSSAGLLVSRSSASSLSSPPPPAPWRAASLPAFRLLDRGSWSRFDSCVSAGGSRRVISGAGTAGAMGAKRVRGDSRSAMAPSSEHREHPEVVHREDRQDEHEEA